MVEGTNFFLILFVGALLLATWVRMSVTHRSLRTAIESRAAQQSSEAEAEATIAQMVTQVSQVADEVNEALSSRTVALEELLRHADRAVTTLGDRGVSGGLVAPGKPFPGGRSTLDDFAEMRRLAESGMNTAEIAQQMHRGREEIRLVLDIATGRDGSDTPTTTNGGIQGEST